MPRVSVLMSVYNGAQYLREAIDSILNQTFKDFEFIIINDCSTDESGHILTNYAAQDSRIVLIENEENLGLTRSLNKGLEVAKGEYIARQDADDISLLERLEKQVQALEAQPEVVLVSCNLELIDADGQLIKTVYRDCSPELIKWHLLFYNHIGGHSQVVFRRQPVVDLGAYLETYRYAQDYELWLRLVKRGDFLILPEVLLQYRYAHEGSISSQKKGSQEEFILLAMQQNLSDLANISLSKLDASNLKYFWERRFPEVRYAGSISSCLGRVYEAFSDELKESQCQDALLHQMREMIIERFIQWIQRLNIKSQPVKFIVLASAAVPWSPKRVFSYCFRRVKKSVLIWSPRLKNFRV